MARPVSAVFPLIHPITYFDLSRTLMDTGETVRWCQTMRRLPSSKNCSCGRGMNLIKRKSCPEEKAWSKRCRILERGNSKRGNFFLKVKSVWGNTSQTFAISDSGSHLEIQVILRLLHLWSTIIHVGKAQDE